MTMDSAFEERYYQSDDGLRLYFRDYPGPGCRVPVLCLPGLTRNGADFDHVAPQLSAHRMIRLDSRGRHVFGD